MRAGRALHLSCSVERKDAVEGLAGGEEGEEVVVVGAGDTSPSMWSGRSVTFDMAWLVAIGSGTGTAAGLGGVRAGRRATKAAQLEVGNG